MSVNATFTAAWIVVASTVTLPPPIIGTPEITDGDTILIADTRIRLWGIDAPETDQLCWDFKDRAYHCGLLASDVLYDEIGGREVVCNPVDTDKYGRTVAICFVDGRDLGDIMVRRGWAIDRPYFSNGKYRDAESEAHREKRGMWAGRFQAPWDWRMEHPQP